MATENKKYIPALRFPEFQNDGEWSMLELGKFAKIVMGQSPSSEAYNERGEGVPLLQGNADIKDRHQVVRVYTTDITKTCDINDIIMTVRAPVGTISRASFKSCIGRGVCAIKTDSEYLYQYLISIEQEWDKLASGSTFVSITSNQIFDRIIFVPLTIQEQKKIADCLSSLDKYIDATKRKLDLLKEHKKGLMQRLFPAKGKTTPELRFPEFQNDGEWVEVPFGSIINVNSGKDYKHLDVGNIPVYGTGGYMLSVNDRLSDIDAVGIGRKGTIDKPQYLKAPFWTVDTLFFLTSSKNYDIRYLYYLCQTIPWKTYGEQTGVPSISKNSIDKLDVVITTNLVEQQKIAQSLLHLDNAMDAIKRKIHLLETYKYGLMQNLFPNLNNY